MKLLFLFSCCLLILAGMTTQEGFVSETRHRPSRSLKEITESLPVAPKEATSLPSALPQSSSVRGASSKLKGIASALSYSLHAPISVSNDAELASIAIRGTGLSNDPYVLEGWNITTPDAVHGITIRDTTQYFIVRNCWIKTDASWDGIYIANAAANTARIAHNICQDNANGIRIENSPNAVVTNNTCLQNTEGGIYLSDSDSATLTNNTCLQNQGTGIGIHGSLYVTVTNNVCARTAFPNGDGIFLNSSGTCEISWNILFANQRWGLLLDGALFSNQVSYNAFFLNNERSSSQASCGYPLNTFEYNYWDEWSNPDTDNDGIVDNPYSIAGSAFDKDLSPLTSAAIIFQRFLDSDRDGLPNFYEVSMGLDPTSNDADLDLDQDGLTNLEEYQLGTRADESDTDGDGLTDGTEVNDLQTNPTNPDTDADGLTDGTEVNDLQTNPTRPDTDEDGLTDGAEVNIHQTNPMRADTDDDGLTDGVEVNDYHTNPNDPDTDGDFFPDGLDYGWRGNPRAIWDNILTRALLMSVLFVLMVWVSFIGYQRPKLQQELQ
ncbi:MAG: NosD domain-containing protein, partial [Candidatus Thorarchaeota archaeon]